MIVCPKYSFPKKNNMLGERRNRKSAQSKILSYPACATERSANIVAGYFLIYRPGYISQRVLKHSWSVFALASGDSARRGALSLFHLAPYEQPSLAKSRLISSSRGAAALRSSTIPRFFSPRRRETDQRLGSRVTAANSPVNHPGRGPKGPL